MSEMSWAQLRSKWSVSENHGRNNPVARGASIEAPGARGALAIFVLGVCSLELANPSSSIQPWNLVMAAAAAIAVMMILLGARHGNSVRQPQLFAVDAAFLSYLLYCGFSAFWSVSPLDTAVQVAYLSIAWLATVLLRTLPATRVIRYVIRIGFFFAVASFAAIIVLPGHAFQPSYALFPELRGIFQHQQRLGLFTGMILALLLIAIFNGERIKSIHMSRFHTKVVAVTLFVCFLWAFARFNMLTVALALVLAVALMRSTTMRVMAMGFAVVLALVLWFDSEWLIAIVGGEDGATLTGRTVVWERTQRAIDDGTIFGYGFASYTSPVFDAYWAGYRAPHAHNSALQANFETGVPGLILLAVLVWCQLRTAYRTGRVLRKVPYSLFLVIATTLNSLMGVTYAGKPTILLLLTLLVVGCEAQEARLLQSVELTRSNGVAS